MLGVWCFWIICRFIRCVFDPIFERGVYVWFLLAYSYDLNSIEFVWSKVKAVLRKLKAKVLGGFAKGSKDGIRCRCS